MIRKQGSWTTYKQKSRNVKRGFCTCKMLLVWHKRRFFFVSDEKKRREQNCTSKKLQNIAINIPILLYGLIMFVLGSGTPRTHRRQSSVLRLQREAIITYQHTRLPSQRTRWRKVRLLQHLHGRQASLFEEVSGVCETTQ